MRALGWGPGDEVLTSPFSFVASANCLLYEGVRPVFCDVDAETLNLDPVPSQAAAGARTVGILPVHIFGYPAAMAELETIAARHGLGVLEDACEALGAIDSEGSRSAPRGNLATFAFYANKQLTTGEGGMITAPDPALAARLRASATRAAPQIWAGSTMVASASTTGSSDLASALGVAQLERLDSMLAGRSRVAALYEQRLSAIDSVAPRSPEQMPSAAVGSSTLCALPIDIDRDAAIDQPGPDGGSPARPTCPASTSFRSCASSATGRGSSR